MREDIEVVLPTLHPSQVAAWRERTRFQAVRAGRRWGKTDYAKTIACDLAIRGRNIGWFAPSYKIQSEAYYDIAHILQPVRAASSKIDGVFRTITGGRIDFWTLEDERAGRSRKYDLVVIDEAAFTKPNMLDIWQKSIRPTLVDTQGSALVISNTNGQAPDNFLYAICNDQEGEARYGFSVFHATTFDNPYLPPAELETLERDNHPLVFRQEYLAEFVDFSGAAFFALPALLADGRPLPYPSRCDAVFAVIDTAVKTGSDNDGTAVVYCAFDRFQSPPLHILDWDCIQIEGALLETWLPTVFENLDRLAGQCRARMGSQGAWIEDKSSGMVLLQQARRRGWSATPIDAAMTSLGKDERAISVSGYVYRGEVKLTGPAYDKVTRYKNTTRNHLIGQVTDFRLGAKNQGRQDDLLDCFCYAIAVSLGDSRGF